VHLASEFLKSVNQTKKHFLEKNSKEYKNAELSADFKTVDKVVKNSLRNVMKKNVKIVIKMDKLRRSLFSLSIICCDFYYFSWHKIMLFGPLFIFFKLTVLALSALLENL
jgi:hypothetical protein